MTESGSFVYVWDGRALTTQELQWRRPPWSPERFEQLRQTWRQAMADGGAVIGAFADDRLVGEAVFRPNLTERMAQLESLHVSAHCRQMGVARTLTLEVIRLARASGAQALYVSATPSESAVGFYRSIGFAPTNEPHPRLLALEPEDIHMTMPLQ